jgi:hypothetical protein
MEFNLRGLTDEFVEWAFKRYEPWILGNDLLYGLCKRHPRHDSDEAIIAKFWLIGRAYAAAVERRRSKDSLAGDDFYTKSLLRLIRKSEIDAWFDTLKADRKNTAAINIRVHKQVVDLLSTITRAYAGEQPK